MPPGLVHPAVRASEGLAALLRAVFPLLARLGLARVPAQGGRHGRGDPASGRPLRVGDRARRLQRDPGPAQQRVADADGLLAARRVGRLGEQVGRPAGDDRLRQLAPFVKRAFLEACVATVNAAEDSSEPSTPITTRAGRVAGVRCGIWKKVAW